MKLIERMNSQWAIVQDRIEQLANVVRNHIDGPKLTEDEIKERISVSYDWRQGKITAHDYEINGDTGIIYIDGVILQRPSLVERYIFEAIGTEDLMNAMNVLLADESVKRIIMFVSSPGGTVPGVMELSDFIFAARQKKEIIAFTDSMMCSAAYWIGSAAEKIYVSSETVAVGSIGVYCTHFDFSKMLENFGVKATHIFAGKYKTAGSSYQPLDDVSKEYIQKGVDRTYSLFVGAVARNRKTTTESVIVNMADGRVFNGSDAVTAGLVDGVATFDTLMGGISPLIPMDNEEPGDGEIDPKNEEEESAMSFTKEQLIKENKPLYDQIFSEGAASVVSADALENAKKEGANAQLTRIKGVKEAALPGYDKEIEAMMFDGSTTAEQAALKLVTLENASRKERLDAGSEVLPSGGERQSESHAGVQNLSVDDQAKAEWEKDKNLHSEFRNYDEYLAYFKHTKKDGK